MFTAWIILSTLESVQPPPPASSLTSSTSPVASSLLALPGETMCSSDQHGLQRMAALILLVPPWDLWIRHGGAGERGFHGNLSWRHLVASWITREKASRPDPRGWVLRTLLSVHHVTGKEASLSIILGLLGLAEQGTQTGPVSQALPTVPTAPACPHLRLTDNAPNMSTPSSWNEGVHYLTWCSGLNSISPTFISTRNPCTWPYWETGSLQMWPV